MSSLGDQCHTKKLFCEVLGEDDHPVEMHVSKLNFKTSMEMVESDSSSMTSSAIEKNSSATGS